MTKKSKLAKQTQKLKATQNQANKLVTVWGENLDKSAVLTEYPRPQLQRDSYINLNGVWQYAILNKSEALIEYQGDILVPFSPESILSGVEKIVTSNDILYYKRQFELSKSFVKDKIILHFGAVDYSCKVYINKGFAGGHTGGYLPFSLDITQLVKVGTNEITLEVIDPSDAGTQARGKQKIDRGNIWYTPSSGIWQTVWLESVFSTYVRNLKITPDIDAERVVIELDTAGDATAAEVTVLERGKAIAKVYVEKLAIIDIKNPILWTPESPFLYDVEVKLDDDKVKSYFGMRKFSIGLDENNINRLLLNNKSYFHNGVLDQGYWSDGLYTAASDEALIYDIQKMKDLGFNMLRKHIKIEPLRWYYHCDRLGMLVWQDFVSGGRAYSPMTIAVRPFLGLLFANKKFGNLKDNAKNYKKFSRSCAKSRDEFIREMYLTIDLLYNVPSLAVWVPFNEGWGQFDSVEIAKSVKNYDPTRIVDHASGWHDQGGPDLNSFHIYFTKYAFPKNKTLKADTRPIALTEFGGYGYISPKHTWDNNKIFCYRIYKSKEKLTERYKKLYESKVISNIPKGLAAAVYTQLSDVEEEVNGIYTYDRKELKIEKATVACLNEKINKYNS